MPAHTGQHPFSAHLEVPDPLLEVDGIRPVAVARPATTAALAEIMTEASGQHLSVVPKGSGSAMAFGPPPHRADLIVDMRAMCAVTEYAPRDLVLGVGAGVTLGQIDRVLAAEGQRLAIDLGPAAESRTIGGVVATNGRGPRRVDVGSLRDIVIGVTVVRADGVVAKAGGKVVKNVAGYDLAKLMVGSHGTLAVISDLYLRVHPVPPARALLVIGGPIAALCAAVRAIARSPIVGSAMEMRCAPDEVGARLYVLFEGTERSVSRQSALVTEQYRDAREIDDLPPDWYMTPPQHDAVVLRIAFAPGELHEVLEVLRNVLGPSSAIACSAASGLARVLIEPGAVDADGLGSALATLRARLALWDGSVVIEHAPLPLRTDIDVWGPTCAPALMLALKDQFDPDHRLNPGRFVEGI
ncbi:MAG: FAD-binding oxidoreductase [Acidimicrobiales bacterium]